MPSNGEMKAMTDEKRLSKLDIDGVKARACNLSPRGVRTRQSKPSSSEENMAKLDINGYNATFRTFVEFAQKTQRDGYDSACATATFAGKRITVSALSLHETSHLLRKTAEEVSNDSTRAIFRNAVSEMFGGEAKIPESVKKAMLLGDYGDGKPLTARRIMAVKDAIDAEDSMREKEVSPHDFRRDVRRGGSCHRLRQGHRRQGHGSAATSIQSNSRAFTTRFRRAASAATSTAASSHTASRPTSTWPSRSPSSSLTAIDGAGQDCLGRDCPNMV